MRIGLDPTSPLKKDLYNQRTSAPTLLYLGDQNCPLLSGKKTVGPSTSRFVWPTADTSYQQGVDLRYKVVVLFSPVNFIFSYFLFFYKCTLSRSSVADTNTDTWTLLWKRPMNLEV